MFIYLTPSTPALDVIDTLAQRFTLLPLSNATSHESATSVFAAPVTLDKAALQQAATTHAIDCAFFANCPRWQDFRLLVCDMDSTLITIECIDEIGSYLGIKDKIAAITQRSMAGELDFSTSLRERVALLAGTPVAALETVLHEKMTLTPGALTLIQRARFFNVMTVVVSGGFTFFTSALQQKLGLDEHYANELEIKDGLLTGHLIGRLIAAQDKADLLRQIAQRLGITPQQTIAVGDGANDLLMLGAAGLAVAFHAKPTVRAQVPQQINFGGLDVLDGWLS